MRGWTGSSIKAASTLLLSGALLTGAAVTAFAQAQSFNVVLDGTPMPFVMTGVPATARAGAPITFNARNTGAAGETGLRHTHNIAIDRADGTTIQSPVPNFTGGQSATITFDALPPGTYTVYCPVGQHRNNGMSAQMTVVAGAVALPATGGFALPAGLAIAGVAAAGVGVALRRRA